MPPWRSEPGYGDFIDQKPLSDSEIETIARWAAAGAPEGKPSQLPAPPHWSADWHFGTPDVVVTLPEPFVLRADGPDVSRIFVFRVPTDRTRYVKGFEFRPGNTRVVHHANIRIDRTPASRELDDRDPLPGYEGVRLHSAVYPDGHFLGWTPGQVAPLLPKGLAWTLTPGTDLVIEMHLVPSGKVESVQPSIALYFTDDPPELTPEMLRLGRQSIDIPPGEKNYVETDSFVLPVDVEVLAVQPHGSAIPASDRPGPGAGTRAAAGFAHSGLLPQGVRPPRRQLFRRQFEERIQQGVHGWKQEIAREQLQTHGR